MTLRPRLIVRATVVTWVVFMGGALYASAIWTSYENFAVASEHARGNGVITGLDGEGIGTLPSSSGGQEPPSLPGNRSRAHAENSLAMGGTPGSVRSSSVKPLQSGLRETVASAQGGRGAEVHSSNNQGRRRNGGVIPPPVSSKGADRDSSWKASPSTTTKSGRATLGIGSLSRPVLHALATNAANLCGVPVRLFHSLIARESSWRPYVVSSSGAVGLAQVKPSTARDVSPGLDVHDPWQNLVAGSCYLRQQFDRFGTWRSALKAYHAGPNRKATKQATHDYASDILEGSAQ